MLWDVSGLCGGKLSLQRGGGVWCCERRDTRGKRGYDGVLGAGVTGSGGEGGGRRTPLCHPCLRWGKLRDISPRAAGGEGRGWVDLGV